MINNSTDKIMDGYLAIVLSEEAQKLLLTKFPPIHQKIFAHHVTVAFKPVMEVYDTYKDHVGEVIDLHVTGYSKDEKGQAVLVENDLLKDGQYHITISTNGVPPYYSKALLEKGYEPIKEELVLQGTFQFISH